ncbi:DUF669 domain-containing protein [Pasteurella multocida]
MRPFDPTLNYRTLTPAGTYDVVVAHAYERLSRNGNPYISLGLRILSEKNHNRIIWRNFFLEGDPESYATQRSQEELAALCRAVSFTDVLTSPSDLINDVQFVALVEHYKASTGELAENVRYVSEPETKMHYGDKEASAKSV